LNEAQILQLVVRVSCTIKCHFRVETSTDLDYALNEASFDKKCYTLYYKTEELRYPRRDIKDETKDRKVVKANPSF
jgi:hypothetical protein